MTTPSQAITFILAVEVKKWRDFIVVGGGTVVSVSHTFNMYFRDRSCVQYLD